MYICSIHIFFFFSSRRRHTRFDCDWSSDVCSSDLFRVECLRLFPRRRQGALVDGRRLRVHDVLQRLDAHRSEEHTSELQSQSNLVCRLLLEKKKITWPSCYLCSILHVVHCHTSSSR